MNAWLHLYLVGFGYFLGYAHGTTNAAVKLTAQDLARHADSLEEAGWFGEILARLTFAALWPYMVLRKLFSLITKP